ncbi:Hypothetical predicted protein [Mytilus galloprovincialis]|uniref:B box-type domain-containing protein n=1 Tax=Mytilus galloprovincialis TaxID=29158 RepID=A0A8B6FXK2_MYTGA|nr:Hypothetical predicted protein [Mytilus galloprovincialis]
MAFSKSVQIPVEQKGQISVECEFCEGGNKIKYKCLDCQVLMCSRCKDKVHARFKNAIGHKVKDIKELGKLEEVDTFNFSDVKCLVHSDQVCCVYCKTCKKVICVKCITKYHNGHTFIDEEELDIKKKKIKDNCERAEGNIQYTVEILNKIEELKEQEDAKFKKNKQDICIRREALKSEVDRYTDKLVKDLEQTWKSNSRVIETEHGKMNKALENLLISCNSAKIVTTSRDFKKFFDNFDQLAISLAEGLPPGRLDCHLGVLRFPKPENFELLGRFIPASKFEVMSFGSMSYRILDIHHDLHSKIECKVSKVFTTDLRNVHCIARCVDGTLWIYDSISEKLQYINYVKNDIKVMLELQITVLGMFVMSACNNLLMSVAGETRLQIVNSSTGQMTDSNYHEEPIAGLSVPNCVHLTKNDTVIIGVGVLEKNVEPAVIVMGHDGRCLSKYEQRLYNKPLFTCPKGITTTKNGNICVLDCPDADHKRVVVLGKKGEYKQIYTGHYRLNKGRMKQFTPTDLLTTPADNIVITDFHTSLLHVLNCEAKFIGYYKVYGIGIIYPSSLALSTEGHMYIGCSTETDEPETLKAKVYEVEYSGF